MIFKVWEPLVQRFKIPVPGSSPHSDLTALGWDHWYHFPLPRFPDVSNVLPRMRPALYGQMKQMDGPLLGFHSGFSGVSFSWHHQGQMVEERLVQRLFPEVHGLSYAFFPLTCSLQSSTGLLKEMMIFFFNNQENSAAVTRWLIVLLCFHQFPPDSLSLTSFQADWFSFDLSVWDFVQDWEREGGVQGGGNFLEDKHNSDCTKVG